MVTEEGAGGSIAETVVNTEEKAPVPTSFFAATLNLYVVPSVVTTETDVVVMSWSKLNVSPVPPPFQCTEYPVIGSPPVETPVGAWISSTMLVRVLALFLAGRDGAAGTATINADPSLSVL